MAVQFMRIESKIWIEVPRHHSTLRSYTTNCLFSSDSSVHPGGHKQSCGPCSENRYSTQLEESVEDNQIYQFWLVRVPKFWCSVQISHLFVVQDSSTWRQPRASLRLQNQTNARFQVSRATMGCQEDSMCPPGTVCQGTRLPAVLVSTVKSWGVQGKWSKVDEKEFLEYHIWKVEVRCIQFHRIQHIVPVR